MNLGADVYTMACCISWGGEATSLLIVRYTRHLKCQHVRAAVFKLKIYFKVNTKYHHHKPSGLCTEVYVDIHAFDIVSLVEENKVFSQFDFQLSGL